MVSGVKNRSPKADEVKGAPKHNLIRTAIIHQYENGRPDSNGMRRSPRQWQRQQGSQFRHSQKHKARDQKANEDPN